MKSMVKYFVDTTVLTDALLKDTDRAKDARSILASAESELPVFAIREFKAGPLRYLVWLHNKLVELKSIAGVLQAIHALSRTPQRYLTSTAIEALAAAQASSIAGATFASLASKYGKMANPDSAQADEIRVHLHRAVSRAWSRRRSLTTRTVQRLSCYQETSPVERRGMLELTPNRCLVNRECCLARLLREAPDDLAKLRSANKEMPANQESQRRGRVLKDLLRKPGYLLDESSCRHLGDALFAFFAPSDARILTTNLKDHGPLAAALGKVAVTPAGEKI